MFFFSFNTAASCKRQYKVWLYISPSTWSEALTRSLWISFCHWTRGTLQGTSAVKSAGQMSVSISRLDTDANLCFNVSAHRNAPSITPIAALLCLCVRTRWGNWENMSWIISGSLVVLAGILLCILIEWWLISKSAWFTDKKISILVLPAWHLYVTMRLVLWYNRLAGQTVQMW